MPHPRPADALIDKLDEALDLLRDYPLPSAPTTTPAEPLSSLLAQCEAAVAAIPGREPLRSIHHFACTGGTLISKVLAGMPNTVLLSEIDPLSRNIPEVRFLPTDVIFALRQSIRAVDADIVIATFVAAISAAREGLERRGNHLILRDHSHSQFCRDDTDQRTRPTLHDMLSEHFAMRSVVTVRHPLDSFLSLDEHGWIDFSPGTLGVYAKRYVAFLDRHADIAIIRYEDFVADPDGVSRELCDILALNHSPFAGELAPLVRMSGDSGRNEGPIAARPRRPVPDAVTAARSRSKTYRKLCRRLGYEP
ncbi:MAG: Sulfotransferase family [Porphyrobacter sp. HL-46]|nr:MAG: Sulfotransferase family [Porphyrobacter sp. HL-46]